MLIPFGVNIITSFLKLGASLTMSYTIRNMTKSTVSVGGLTWARNESKTLAFVNRDIIDLVEQGGTLYCADDLTPIKDVSAITNTMSVVTDSSTGTAATIADGAVTIAAVSSTETAADAIATLAVELAAARTVINALVTRISLLENSINLLDNSVHRSTPGG